MAAWFPTRRLQFRYALAIIAVVSAASMAGRLEAQQGPDRSKPPAPGTTPSLKLPAIQKRALSNGVPVWIVGMHEVPVLDVTLIVKSGTTADPVGKYGLANFTAAMLDEGAGTRNALELADAIDVLGASLSTNSSFDASTVHLHALVSKFDAALPLFADVALRPTFPEADLERLRKERLTSILQSRDDPASLVALGFSRLLYGRQHRFGTATIGDEASNTALTAADLRAFYTSHYQPQNATLLVVGDATADTMLPKLERAFGAWKGDGTAQKPVIAPAPQPASRQIYLIDKPGAAQSQIRMGLIGVARNTPDYFVINVMNTMLGGSFSSRLMQNLREEHGYAYTASSTFSMRSIPGPFMAAAGVQSDKTVESLQEFFKEIDGMRAPVPADDLRRVRNLESLSFPGRFETTTNMAGELADLIVYGIPESFLTEYVSKTQAVTAADLERAAKQYLQSDKFVVVVVGDIAKIEQPIRAASLGPVTVVPVADILQ
jgi:predicted Zn-dependent peptidase